MRSFDSGEGSAGTPGVNLYLDRAFFSIDGDTILRNDVRDDTVRSQRWAARARCVRAVAGTTTPTADIDVLNFGLTESMCTIDVGWVFRNAGGEHVSVGHGQSLVIVPPAYWDRNAGAFGPGTATARVACSVAPQGDEEPATILTTVADPMFQPYMGWQSQLVTAIRDNRLLDVQSLQDGAMRSHLLAVHTIEASGLFRLTGGIPALRMTASLLIAATRSAGTGSTGAIRLTHLDLSGTERELFLWDPVADEGAEQWQLVPNLPPGSLHCSLTASFQGSSSQVTNRANPDRVRVRVIPGASASVTSGGDGIAIGIDDALGIDNDDDYRIAVLAY